MFSLSFCSFPVGNWIWMHYNLDLIIFHCVRVHWMSGPTNRRWPQVHFQLTEENNHLASLEVTGNRQDFFPATLVYRELCSYPNFSCQWMNTDLWHCRKSDTWERNQCCCQYYKFKISFKARLSYLIHVEYRENVWYVKHRTSYFLASSQITKIIIIIIIKEDGNQSVSVKMLQEILKGRRLYRRYSRVFSEDTHPLVNHKDILKQEIRRLFISNVGFNCSTGYQLYHETTRKLISS